MKEHPRDVADWLLEIRYLQRAIDTMRGVVEPLVAFLPPEIR
jgi:hypothetical protein